MDYAAHTYSAWPRRAWPPAGVAAETLAVSPRCSACTWALSGRPQPLRAVRVCSGAGCGHGSASSDPAADIKQSSEQKQPPIAETSHAPRDRQRSLHAAYSAQVPRGRLAHGLRKGRAATCRLTSHLAQMKYAAQAGPRAWQMRRVACVLAQVTLLRQMRQRSRRASAGELRSCVTVPSLSRLALKRFSSLQPPGAFAACPPCASRSVGLPGCYSCTVCAAVCRTADLASKVAMG